MPADRAASSRLMPSSALAIARMRRATRVSASAFASLRSTAERAVPAYLQRRHDALPRIIEREGITIPAPTESHPRNTSRSIGWGGMRPRPAAPRQNGDAAPATVDRPPRYCAQDRIPQSEIGDRRSLPAHPTQKGAPYRQGATSHRRAKPTAAASSPRGVARDGPSDQRSFARGCGWWTRSHVTAPSAATIATARTPMTARMICNTQPSDISGG